MIVGLPFAQSHAYCMFYAHRRRIFDVVLHQCSHIKSSDNVHHTVCQTGFSRLDVRVQGGSCYQITSSRSRYIFMRSLSCLLETPCNRRCLCVSYENETESHYVVLLPVIDMER